MPDDCTGLLIGVENFVVIGVGIEVILWGLRAVLVADSEIMRGIGVGLILMILISESFSFFVSIFSRLVFFFCSAIFELTIVDVLGMEVLLQPTNAHIKIMVHMTDSKLLNM